MQFGDLHHIEFFGSEKNTRPNLEPETFPSPQQERIIC
jgi:hypothetical protein